MKRRYLVLGMLAVALKGKPQANDSTYKKKEIPKSDIEVVFSMYAQDGDHSAVTGGIGTEKLSVYAPKFNLDINRSKNSFSIAGGADIITSASTDRIDDVISSASKTDVRSHADLQYSRSITKKDIQVGIGAGYSLESDYLSFPVRLQLKYSSPQQMRQYLLSVAAFFDDLRWGRLNPDYRRPVKLIYPSELRYKEWYNIHNRYSYNFKTGFVQVINKRLVAALYPELIIQRGLLATPFHRVYFTDDSVKVEKLPEKRIKIPVGAKINWFAGSRTILKTGISVYKDNFGINAITMNVETAVRVSPMVTLSPFGEFYRQSGSKYFKPYKEHHPTEEYYTSDYDLSAFSAFKAGLTFRWAPFKYLSKKSVFESVDLRYAYFVRSDGLQAHMITSAFRLSKIKK